MEIHKRPYSQLNRIKKKRNAKPIKVKQVRRLLQGAYISFNNEVCRIYCYKFLFRTDKAYPTIRIVIETSKGLVERSPRRNFVFIGATEKYKKEMEYLVSVEQYIKSYVKCIRAGIKCKEHYPKLAMRKFLALNHSYDLEGNIVKECTLHEYLLTFKKNRL